jgi:DNA-binding XRE family transcriptional regulator
MVKNYDLKKSQIRANYWVCVDLRYKVMCEFEQGKFNETQEFTMLEDMPADANLLAKIAREMGDYLRENHYELIFNDVHAKRVAFCKSIAELRKQRGMSQVEVAEKIGIKQASLARIESGRFSPTFDLLQKIADVLNVTLKLE